GRADRARRVNPPLSDDGSRRSATPSCRNAPTETITNDADATRATLTTLRPGRTEAARRPRAETERAARAVRGRERRRCDTASTAASSSDAPAPKKAPV